MTRISSTVGKNCQFINGCLLGLLKCNVDTAVAYTAQGTSFGWALWDRVGVFVTVYMQF